MMQASGAHCDRAAACRPYGLFNYYPPDTWQVEDTGIPIPRPDDNVTFWQALWSFFFGVYGDPPHQLYTSSESV